MSNRIDRLEARAQALSAQTAPVVLLIETENGTQRMTVSQYTPPVVWPLCRSGRTRKH